MNNKWFFLFFASFTEFGKYFILDMPGLTKNEFLEVFNKDNSVQTSEYYFSLLYSVYNLPNMILPLIGGLMADNFGSRILTIIFTLTITFSAILFYIGIIYSSFSLMIAARFIFGLVGEILDISSFNIIIEHFYNSKNLLPIASGFRFVSIKLAAILNSIITPFLSKNVSLSFCYLFPIIPSLLSLLFAILIRIKEVDQIFSKELNSINFKSQFEKLKKFIKIQAKIDFWILTLITNLLYSSLFTFNAFASGMVVDDWMNSLKISIKSKQNNAGSYITTLFMVGLLLTILFSFLLSKFNIKGKFLIIGSFFSILGYISFLFIHNYIPFILLGISYSFFGSTIWPTFSEIIPEENRGLGFGIVYCLQNIGLGFCPIISTFLKHQFGNKNSAIINFFIFLGFISLILAVFFEKYRNNNEKIDNVYSNFGNSEKELEEIPINYSN